MSEHVDAATREEPRGLLRSTEGEQATLLGMEVRILHRDGMGRFSLVEFTVPPSTAQAPPPHLHRATEELLHVVEGALQVQVGEAVLAAGAGDTVRIPPGTPHTFWNPGEAGCRCLALCTPAGFERFFIDVAKGLAAGDGSPERAREIRDDLAARYDVEYGPRP